MRKQGTCEGAKGKVLEELLEVQGLLGTVTQMVRQFVEQLIAVSLEDIRHCAQLQGAEQPRGNLPLPNPFLPVRNEDTLSRD
jgi:hypothetical protein